MKEYNWHSWESSKLPEGGKNLVVLDEKGDTYYCFRCSCCQTCNTLKDSLCGSPLLISPKFWVYNEGSVVPDKIEE